MIAILDFLDGKKTYIAGAGLFALAIYDLTVANYVGAYQNAMAALAAVGLRHAVDKVPAAVVAKTPTVVASTVRPISPRA